MRALTLIALLLAVVAVVAGVLIEGTRENPVNLVMPWLLGATVLELAARRRSAMLRLVFVPVVLGAAAAGVAWTLGPEHMTSAGSALVWIGVAGAIAASVEEAAVRARSAAAAAA